MAKRGNGAAKAGAADGWQRMREDIRRRQGHRAGQSHAMANLTRAAGVAMSAGGFCTDAGSNVAREWQG